MKVGRGWTFFQKLINGGGNDYSVLEGIWKWGSLDDLITENPLELIREWSIAGYWLNCSNKSTHLKLSKSTITYISAACLPDGKSKREACSHSLNNRSS